ncbi:response regulator receiver domain [Kordiimonas marina]|uniref:response regulator receiver domain n=1 Tax=Kordiimonas marina TaxID=2872312 RepID=UPI001FF31747|nr:response regulator receiver domain [Kordiimonas marina]MCJ9430731.1 hypothetical protein [Kordiimonas marina]
MADLEEKIATEFLRTAVIIDDKAAMSSVAEVVDDLQEAGMELVDEDEPLEVIPVEGAGPRDVTDGNLDVQAVVGAYLKLGIMCGVFQPPEDISPEKLIEETTDAVVNADIVILDWFLKPNDETLILKLLEKIFELDQAQNGRLRSVIIYTDNPKLAECVNATKEALEAYGLEDEEGDPYSLMGDGVRVKFFNKQGSLGPAPISEAALPAETVKEFVKLTRGLMPTLALSAVNSLRKNTHHLLSVFKNSLDPALVGHRLLLDDSDDVMGFGFDVLTQQLRAILATDRIHHACLSEERFTAWFDTKYGTLGEEGALKGVVPLELVRKGLSEGLDEVRQKYNAKHNVSKGIFPRQAHKRLFDEDTAKEESTTNILGRLSKLSREADGFHSLPQGWRPTLSMGSVVKSRGNYYFCAMPVCDAVRITGSRYFPLLRLEACTGGNTNAFRIYLKDGDESLKLKLSVGAEHNQYEKFLANPKHQRVLGVLKKETGQYVFRTTDDAEYIWIADVDPMHAHRIAAEANTKLTRIGVDEFEWLRRGF